MSSGSCWRVAVKRDDDAPLRLVEAGGEGGGSGRSCGAGG